MIRNASSTAIGTVTPAVDARAFQEEPDSETAAFNVALEGRLASQPPLHKQEPQEIRAARERGESIFGPVAYSSLAEDLTIDGPLSVRVFTPPEVRGIYLHLHGGGWVLGSARLQDPRLEELATTCRVAVVSVDYRLAPEHPYPAGPDDCERVALWLVEHSPADFGTEALLIGGESVGAQLSVVTLLRLRDRHHVRGFLAANLAYGLFDLTLTPSSARWGDRPLGLTTADLQWFIDLFVPEELRREPDVSPLFAELSGLPPALFTVGTLDPLLDDTLFMWARWAAAGNQAELAIEPGGVHSFNAFPTSLAARANRRIYEFLSSRIEAPD